jgi:hypothetical protein
MHRALETLAWQKGWWKLRAGLQVVDRTLAEVLMAHIETQIKVRSNLAERFQALWKEPLKPTKDNAMRPTDSNAQNGNGGANEDDDGKEDESVDGFSEDVVG